jgi:hypothetical protein
LYELVYGIPRHYVSFSGKGNLIKRLKKRSDMVGKRSKQEQVEIAGAGFDRVKELGEKRRCRIKKNENGS